MAGISKRIRGSWVSSDYGVMKTATDTITTLPADIYSNDTTATVGLKGQTIQSSTPSPTSPVMPQGTGDRTGNLCPVKSFNKTKDRYYTISFSQPLTAGTYTISAIITPSTGVTESRLSFRKSDASQDVATNITIQDGVSTVTVTLLSDCYSLYIYGSSLLAEIVSIAYDNLMIIEGSTAPSSFIPYGYKLDIKSANTTTPVYLGEVETTRKIKKYEFTGSETWNVGSENFYCFVPETSGDGVPYSSVICSHCSGSTINGTGKAVFVKKSEFPNITTGAELKQYCLEQYAAGTPVCVWYVLATETTGIVNEPIRKIGNYADTVSGITIPTIAGKDTFDVLTTLKPSEVSLSYTGWHDATVKEYAHGNSPQILPSAKAESRTSGNITLTCDGNGVYTLVGSPTPNTILTFNIPPTEIPLSVGEGGNGTLSLFNDSVYNNFDIIFIYQGTQYREAVNYSPNTINKTSTTYGSNSSDIGGKTIISIGVRITGYGNINCTFSPMITNDGQLPSTFQPYCSWQ